MAKIETYARTFAKYGYNLLNHILLRLKPVFCSETPITGSLRVRAEAKALGIILTVRPIIEELQAIRYWIEQSIIRDFLEEMGEA